MLEAKTIRRCASFAYLFLFYIGVGFTQSVEQAQRVVFYNCENLFDTINDPLKLDDDYTPSGSRHWTRFRLYEKTLNIAKALVTAGEGIPPMLIGLAEVENDSVMERLVHSTPLRQWDYRYVITHSDDARGIDVALMYQPMDFRLLGSQAVRIQMPQGAKPTRDLLHVWGKIVNTDTLDVIVCHLPSRLGGAMGSNANRHAAHIALRHLTDSICGIRLRPHVIVMGDMNESPRSRSLEKDMAFGKVMTNLMTPLQKDLERGKRSFASHKYQGKWTFLDQFWVNVELLEKANPDKQSQNCVWVDTWDVVCKPFMMVEDETHLGHRPKRSYYGYQYEAGFSDHLPIVLELKIKY